MPVFDPRWSAGTLSYSSIDGNVMVEGDLILGTEDEVLARSWSNAVAAAEQAVGQVKLMNALPDDETRQVIRDLKDKGAATRQRIPRRFAAPSSSAAVRALRIVQDLRPTGPPTSDVERQAVAIMAGESCQFRWPDGVIPYEVTDAPNPGLVASAIVHWETRTSPAVRFVKYEPGKHAEFVRFRKGEKDCYAHSIGRTPGLGATWSPWHPIAASRRSSTRSATS